jgi:hypothetical protein
MMVMGLEMHVASVIMPIFITCELAEAGHKHLPASFGGYQHSRWPQDRTDDISLAERELLEYSVHSRIDDSLVQFDLRLGMRGFGAGSLRRQHRRDLSFDRLFVCQGRRYRGLPPFDDVLKLLDLSLRDRTGVSPLKFGLGFELVHGLLV